MSRSEALRQILRAHDDRLEAGAANLASLVHLCSLLRTSLDAAVEAPGADAAARIEQYCQGVEQMERMFRGTGDADQALTALVRDTLDFARKVLAVLQNADREKEA